MQQEPLPTDRVLDAWGLVGATLTRLGGGLINRTWAVDAPGRTAVLQWVNPIFPAAVNADIAAVTAHLRRHGLATPALIPTREGGLWHVENGAVWRLMTRMPGTSRSRLADAAAARAAGMLLGRFHGALLDFEAAFGHPRGGVHDLSRHLGQLRHTLGAHRAHPRHAEVEPLAREILAAAESLQPLPDTPVRVVHGDPKLDNLLWIDDHEALCLVDLDTLGRLALPLELGDAFRSWCNPRGEDGAVARFSLAHFAAAVDGYAQAAQGWILPGEVAGIVEGTLTIYVELAARFCADALEERYFGWDAQRFASRSLHNQVRARNQLDAALSLRAQRPQAEAAVLAAFAARGG